MNSSKNVKNDNSVEKRVSNKCFSVFWLHSQGS